MYRMNPNLRSFWRTRKTYKILKGGRFSSKTQDAGGMAAFLARNYTLRFLCIRQFQNRIGDSVYTVIKDKIEAAGWTDEFDILNTSIRHKVTGSEFLFYGMARNISDIKGTENIDICWIEEGEGLTEEQWTVIDPTMRKEGSEVWILYNPRLKTDFIETGLVPLLGDDYTVKHINYHDNPFLSDTARQKAERMKRVDPELYDNIYLGIPIADNERAVIKRSWLESAVDAHIKLGIEVSGRKRIGFDVADDGGDKNAMAITYGVLCEDVEEWKGLEDELLKSCTRVWHAAVEHGASIDYDSIGVGASAGAKFAELNESRPRHSRVEYQKFNAGGKVVDPDDEYMPGVKNRDHFANIKAQAWWNVADRLRMTHEAVTNGEKVDPDNIISISSDCSHLEQLLTELSTPHRDFDPSGKVKVESKKDLAKRDVRSPNLADGFIMAYAPRERGTQVAAFMRKRR